MLPSEILCLALTLKYLKVFVGDSDTNVYKPFVDLFPSATHLLCDLKDEVMCDVFGKRLGSYTKDDLVDSESVEE